MQKKPVTLLVFLTLLAFCGQLLATPFLGCHQIAMDEQEMNSPSMGMASAPGDMADVEAPNHQNSLDHTASGSAMQGCDQLCLNCPAVITPRQASPELATVAEQTPLLETFIPPSHLDGLFRPPQAA